MHSPPEQFADHLATLGERYSRALEDTGIADAVLLHSGTEHFYYAEDQVVPFRAFGHFAHWLPVDRADQFVLFTPGERQVYFQLVRRDFWYDQSVDMASWWSDSFRIEVLSVPGELNRFRGSWSKVAYLGEDGVFASALGIPQSLINPPPLLHHLNYCRAYKTPWEIEQIRQANALALIGHEVSKRRFQSGGSEYDIHVAYLNACGILEHQTPYTNIVALDDRAAVLHYQHKRRNDTGNEYDKRSSVLLMDAGCRTNGYCSDITRTSVRPHVHPAFKSLLAAMEQLEKDLVSAVKPGFSYVDFHISAVRGVARLLLEHDICHGDVESLMDQGLASAFMPHGVGHLIGLQVHDVGGRQAGPAGDMTSPPKEYPALRNTRPMEEGMVFTVEPGLYFIPLLLEPLRESREGKQVNWKLVDELLPCGGIRVEDNVLVTSEGSLNLTRNPSSIV